MGTPKKKKDNTLIVTMAVRHMPLGSCRPLCCRPRTPSVDKGVFSVNTNASYRMKIITKATEFQNRNFSEIWIMMNRTFIYRLISGWSTWSLSDWHTIKVTLEMKTFGLQKSLAKRPPLFRTIYHAEMTWKWRPPVHKDHQFLVTRKVFVSRFRCSTGWHKKQHHFCVDFKLLKYDFHIDYFCSSKVHIMYTYAPSTARGMLRAFEQEKIFCYFYHKWYREREKEKQR